MLNKQIDRSVEQIPNINETAISLARAIHKLVLQGGPVARTVADVLHGVGLGHPLHAVLTDVTVGGWLFGTLLDVIWLNERTLSSRRAADTLLTVGSISALPTALSGLADFSTIPERAGGVGLIHALGNVVNLVLFTTSLVLRHGGRRKAAVALSITGLLGATFTALLGGHMAYSLKVGVSKEPSVEPLDDWSPAGDYASMHEGYVRQVDVKGHPILLYRHDDSIYAIESVCPHEGGQLAQGRFDGYRVECPLHQSIFDYRDGRVVHGPATQAIPSYLVRIREGQIHVRQE